MTTKLSKRGSFYTLRIPDSLVAEAGLGEDVELAVQGRRIVVRRPKPVRQGWAESCREMARRGDDKLIGGPWPLTQFDEEEWEW
jgi:antitoxin component of MazEF toxin-antitoxin module